MHVMQGLSMPIDNRRPRGWGRQRPTCFRVTSDELKRDGDYVMQGDRYSERSLLIHLQL
jgi:hypothetical protein